MAIKETIGSRSEEDHIQAIQSLFDYYMNIRHINKSLTGWEKLFGRFTLYRKTK